MSLTSETLKAAKLGATLFELNRRGCVLVDGPDRKSFLNGILSAEISSLPDGLGCYAALLEPKGHYLADLRLFLLPEVVLIDCPKAKSGFLASTLKSYKFRAKVGISDLSQELLCCSLQGEASHGIFAGIYNDIPADPFSTVNMDKDSPVRCASSFSNTGSKGVWFWVEKSKKDAVVNAVAQSGAVMGEDELYHLLRIEAGEPEWNFDIDESIIPLEAGQDRALSFSKCYPGQEVVSRIHFRGHVNRMLRIIRLRGSDIPSLGAQVFAGDRSVGHITSAAYNPEDSAAVCLGYIRREAALNSQPLMVVCERGNIEASSFALPYLPDR